MLQRSGCPYRVDSSHEDLDDVVGDLLSGHLVAGHQVGEEVHPLTLGYPHRQPALHLRHLRIDVLGRWKQKRKRY